MSKPVHVPGSRLSLRWTEVVVVQEGRGSSHPKTMRERSEAPWPSWSQGARKDGFSRTQPQLTMKQSLGWQAEQRISRQPCSQWRPQSQETANHADWSRPRQSCPCRCCHRSRRRCRQTAAVELPLLTAAALEVARAAVVAVAVGKTAVAAAGLISLVALTVCLQPLK